MAAMNFLKKPVCWTAVLLCIPSIGSVAVSLDQRPAGTIHNEPAGQPRDEEIIGLNKTETITPARTPGPSPENRRGKVTASWYGPKHHNKLTAHGKRFNMYKNTLAHRTLPLGTKVRLVNLDNGKFAEGIVNDRGPYVQGRDVDVSYGMAKQLGFVKKGVAKLYLE
jgi:rare lipoprotein A (peptidoglycan hydrolase)